MFEELNGYYEEMAKEVLNISTVDYEDIVLRIKNLNGGCSMGIYYKIDNKYNFIGDLTEQGMINERDYLSVLHKIGDIADKILSWFKENKQDLWTSMILRIDAELNFSVDYGYEKLNEDLFIEDLRWEYEYLGIVPIEKHMKYLKD